MQSSHFLLIWEVKKNCLEAYPNFNLQSFEVHLELYQIVHGIVKIPDSICEITLLMHTSQFCTCNSDVTFE
jgi:hypothetical protein